VVKRSILTLACLTPLIAACGVRPDLPEGAAYIPAGTTLAVSIDPQALAATDLYKELKQQGGAVGMNRLNFERFAQAAGIDPSKDIRKILFVGRPHGAREGGDTPPVDELSAIVTGSFDGSKVHKTLVDSGMPAQSVGGIDIFPILIVEDRCRFCVAILDDTTAAFGDGDTLRAMAEARQAKERSASADPITSKLLARIDPRAAVWGLVRGNDLSAPLLQALSSLGKQGEEGQLAPVSDVSFFLTWDTKVTVAIDAATANDADALKVADVLEGVGTVGRLALKQVKPDAADLLSTFRVQVDGRLLRASANVPAERVMELARGGIGGLFEAATGFGRFSGRTGGGPPSGSAESPPTDAPPPAR
jgi:hypothetical protein